MRGGLLSGRVLLAFALALLVGACAARAPRLDTVVSAPVGELTAVPFFPQTELHCGPAALATVLGAAGVETHPDVLAPRLFIPERGGTLQAELIAEARRHGRIAMRLPTNMQGIADALEAGDPVLVLQNQRLARWPAWHYAVVVGMDLSADTVTLRSGTEARRVEHASDFMRSWSLAERWAVVTVSPDRVPAHADLQRWLRAAAPLEGIGRADVAERAYRAAVERWPDAALAWTALGNALHAQDRVDDAVVAWETALSHAPDFAPARHNLDAVRGTARAEPAPGV